MTTLIRLITDITDRITAINKFLYGRDIETTSDDYLVYMVPTDDSIDPAYITLRIQGEPLCHTRHSQWIAFVVHGKTAYIVRRVDCPVLIQKVTPEKGRLFLNHLIPVAYTDKSQGDTKELHEKINRLTTTVEALTEEVTQKTNELKRKHEEIIILSQRKEDDIATLVTETKVCTECEKELPLSKFIVKSRSKKKDDTQQKEYTSYRKKCGSCRWVGYKKAKVAK